MTRYETLTVVLSSLAFLLSGSTFVLERRARASERTRQASEHVHAAFTHRQAAFDGDPVARRELRRHVEQAVLLRPRDRATRVRVLRYQAFDRELQGDADGARALRLRAVDLAPGDGPAWLDLSLSWRAADRTDDELRCLARAQVDPEVAWIAHGSAAAAHLRLGDLDAAEAEADRSVALAPDRAGPHHRRAEVRRARGDLLGAVAAREAALLAADDEERAEARNRLVGELHRLAAAGGAPALPGAVGDAGRSTRLAAMCLDMAAQNDRPRADDDRLLLAARTLHHVAAARHPEAADVEQPRLLAEIEQEAQRLVVDLSR